MKVAASVVTSRRDRLAESIATEGYLPLASLCRKLGVSVATARRDLVHLQSKGRISRVRGGALPRHRGVVTERQPRQESVVRAVSESIAALFESPAAIALKESICEMGRRCWLRGLVDGSSGHFSARLGDHFLCTPAGVSRGSMRPEMLCLVDSGGQQVASHGHWKRSPEVFVDLAIYRAVPASAAVAHGHPPHATAFSISESEPPSGLLGEFEVFVGPLARVDYRMPGSAELAAMVGSLAPQHLSILLRNHGAICWGASVEDAGLRLEMTETYCQTIAIASRLPGEQSPIPREDLAALLAIKRMLGILDPRLSG